MASVKLRTWTKPDGTTGRAYQVRWIDPATGKRPSKTFDLKKQADDFRRKVEREIEDGIHVCASSSRQLSVVVRSFLENDEERLRDGRIGRSHYLRTELVCRLYIVPKLGNLSAKDLNIEHVSKLYNFLVSRGISPLTARHYLHVFRMIELFARKRGWIKTQPVSDALTELRGLPSKSIETFTSDEVALLLEKASFRIDNGRFRVSSYRRCIVTLGALCGMRLGEILGLRVQDVDLERRVIQIRQNLTKFREIKGPKSAAGRRDIYLPLRAIEPLREWLRVRTH